MASTSGNSIDKNCGDIVFKAARKCLGFDIPFAVCHLPGSDTLDFFCGLETSPRSSGDTSERGKSFEIGKWLTPWADRISIGTRLTPSRAAALEASDLPNLPGLSSSPATSHPDRMISRDEYSAAVSAITERCRLRDGKTVYSRVIAGKNPHLDITKAARELFRAFPDSFGFLYSTPRTGCWLGASPETLLDFDAATRRVSTMAFAGTRPATCGDAPWDDKNLRENRFVADYIRDKFRQLAIEPEISSPRTVRYGVIQHLRRDISAILPPDVDFTRLLDLINPTPALCGSPLEDALRDIRDFELHTRDCYGGFVGIHDARRGFRSFVNLRSARIIPSPQGYFEILAGGGLLNGSDPASEWAETESKASRLLSILSKQD